MAGRKERDLLGEREVPREVYWGVHTLRAQENYNISGRTIGQLPDLVRSIVMVKKACALANNDLGVLADGKMEAIVWACDQILQQGRCLDQFPIDQFQGGAGTSVNMNANEVIANLALEHLGQPKGRYDIISPNDDVNKSQSTNDVYPTALRLAMYQALDRLSSEQIRGLQKAFEAKAVEFDDVLKLGRTQLQDAVPMTLGSEFGAFGVLMAEERRYFEAMATLLLEVNIGATAIGTGINTPPGYAERAIVRLSEVTGLRVHLAANLVEATSDCGAYVSAHAALKRVAIKLAKICNDLRLLSSGPGAGFAEIRLPERAAGSSIMPAKINPIIPEVVNQVCFKVLGNDHVVTLAAEAGQLQLNVFEPVIAQATFESIQLLTAGLDTLREKCVVGITADAERCYRYVMDSMGVLTYLNPVFGHAVCDDIGREAASRRVSARQVVLERGLLTPEQLEETIQAGRAVLRRTPPNVGHR